jgi:predicted RNA binding protein YcfA (HicA-like mRNA interferase family)
LSAPKIKGLDCIKRLVNDFEWQVVRHEGSHYTLKKNNEPKILTVTLHDSKTVAIGTLLQILRKAGITKEEFFASKKSKK